ncbi:two-component sensor histidine kinase [Thioalkalivibrio denitrificans]|uniref:histidine kinase n=1 Tax=Thioalkalivibrio denitrificans TaxID=108003 RepID=A0A1V3NEA5_9GAMM|nr:HAMP domain-containing sensor histidine kinase [Thioalkalivibrio denitrificans]OOG23355.1 two-component sensor histidine kinase [Thioalkalivibrio denitrificans]
MRLRTNISLWVSLATVLPLTVLVLLVTGYSERQYSSDRDREIGASLNTLVAEIDRRLMFEREVISALVESAPMQAFQSVLSQARDGHKHPQFNLRAAQLGIFLEEFTALIPDVGTIRVLDVRGNTLLMIRDRQVMPTHYEGMDPYPYAEEELDDEAFLQRLRSSPLGEVSYQLLPESRSDYVFGAIPPMYDAVVPIEREGEGVVGYLLANSTGLQIERMLELAPRLSEGRLTVAELNPDRPDREGLILFDEGSGLLFTHGKRPELRLDTLFGTRVANTMATRPFGATDLTTRPSRVYHAEYTPYPNQLASWLVISEVRHDAVTAPFKRIRQGILLLAALALIASLLLAQVSARRIARPITRLAHNLKAYARGEPLERTEPHGTQEIRQLQDSFNYMAETLERARRDRDEAQHMLVQSAKLASIGEMAAGIGHELNNPLNNILSLGKLIRRELPAEHTRLREDVQSLMDEAQRASRIVNGILNFARQVPPRYEAIDVRPWAEETLILVNQAAKAQEVTIRLEVEEGLMMEGDVHQLRQVLINLLLNAIQASHPGDEVLIMARHEADGDIYFCVCDQGTGVDPDILDKLFDPFFTTKPVGRGSGLGLSVSLGIVERHGGHIDIRPNEHGGVTATVRLPARQVQGKREKGKGMGAEA